MSNGNFPAFDYALAAIDIDDTLVGHDKRIGAANREAVRRLADAGCRVVLASGRRHDNMLPYARELGLSDYLVSCQGAISRHMETGEVIHRATLPAFDAAEALADGSERGLTVMYWCCDGVFSRQRTPLVDRYTADTGDAVTLLDVESLAGSGTAHAEKVVWGGDPAAIDVFAREMRTRYAGRMIVTVTEDWFMELTAPHATKAAGVAAVARRYGIAANRVLAFGDGNNDVALLSWAGLGVAMPHGRLSARQAADRVAPEGDVESALSRAVEQLLPSPAHAAA